MICRHEDKIKQIKNGWADSKDRRMNQDITYFLYTLTVGREMVSRSQHNGERRDDLVTT